MDSTNRQVVLDAAQTPVLPDFREIRMKLVTSLDIDEIERLLDHILLTYPPN